jgi:hypothetical protein
MNLNRQERAENREGGLGRDVWMMPRRDLGGNVDGDGVGVGVGGEVGGDCGDGWGEEGEEDQTAQWEGGKQGGV